MEADLRGDVQAAVFERRVEFATRENIRDTSLPGRIQIHPAVDPAHPPLVLVLDEARVRPLHDDTGERVRLAHDNKRRHIELGRQPRVLAHADRAAVHVNVEHAFRAPDMQHDPAPVPLRRELEPRAVAAGGVLAGHRGRLVRERHLDVRVVRAVEPVHRPVAWHRQARPAGRFEFRPDELRRDVLDARGEVELPVSVEGFEPRRLLAVERPRARGVGK